LGGFERCGGRGHRGICYGSLAFIEAMKQTTFDGVALIPKTDI